MILLPSSFCPSVGYLALISAADAGEVGIDLREPYRKQTLRNRTLLMTAGGVEPFTVPVEKFGYPPPPISEISISEHGDWRRKLEHALRSGYGLAPFWAHYEDEIHALIFDNRDTSLVGYNAKWLHWLCRQWDLMPPPAVTVSRENAPVVTLEALSAVPQERYWQVFEEKYGFTPGLSALDLLLSEGPYAVTYLRRLGLKLLSSTPLSAH